MNGQWVRRATGQDVVVFVHGILSNGEACWKNPNGAYWPSLVEADSTLGSIGIYVFTYQTEVFSGTYRLGDVVDALKEQLRLDRVLDCRHLFFVCHSMGGIVVRRFIVERQADLIAASTQIGLFLVASPSLGSSYANWLTPLARLMRHSQADALRFSQTNDWLNDLDKEFQNLKESHRIPIFGRELLEDRFVKFKRLVWFEQVVPPFSGARYFGEQFKVPRSDHFSIAKPEDGQAVQHRLLCTFITETLATMRQDRRDDLISAITTGGVAPVQALAELLKSSLPALAAAPEPDPIDALGAVLDEISKLYQLMDTELTRYLSLTFDDPQQATRDREVLLSLEGGLIRERAAMARGHCHKIGRLYYQRLHNWFQSRLSPDQFELVSAAFRTLSDSDGNMADRISQLADWLSSRAAQTLNLVDAARPVEARQRVRDARLDCHPMRQKLAATVAAMRDVQAELIRLAP
jgi:Putative serine esterase (DUF676)